MARKRNPIAMAAGLAAVAAAMAVVIREAQPSSPPALPPPPPRPRQPKAREIIAEHLILTWPDMPVEDVARIANAWPGNLNLVAPRRFQ